MSFLVQQLFKLRDLVSPMGRPSRRASKKRPRLELELLEKRLNPTPNTWTGTFDHITWNQAGNWSAGIPVAGQDVTIPTGTGSTSITLSGTAAKIDSLTTSVPVYVQGTTLALSGGGTVATGGVTLMNSATLTITNNGTVSIGTNNQTIGGDSTGAVVFGDASPSNAITTASSITLTLAAGTSIDGKVGLLNGSGSITNNGTIKALTSGNITLSTSVAGNGTITTDGTSTVTQNGALINGNTIAGLLNYTNNNSDELLNDTISSSGVVTGNFSVERVSGGLTLNGVVNINGGSYFGFGVAAAESITLKGSGSIAFDSSTSNNRISLEGGAQLTVTAGITIHGQIGTIGGFFFAAPAGNLINNGTILADVNGGTLNLSTSTITNNGTLQALHGGHLSLNTLIQGSGTITTDGTSTITQSADTISGNTIAGLLTFTNTSANVLLNDTISSSGVATGNQGEDRVSGGLTLNGIVNINAFTDFVFGVAANESITLKGSGSVAFDSNVNNHLALDAGVQLTVASGITIHGQNGIVGPAVFVGPTGTIINNGVIRDDVLGGTLNINSTTITNNGTLQALNGGNLNLASPVAGSGTITTDGSSTVTQSAITITGQTIAGLLNYNSSGSNRLSSDTVTTGGVLLGIGGAERVTGALTLNGVIDIDGGSAFGFGVAANESITLNSSATITFDGNTSNHLSLDNGVVLTLGPGFTVNGKNGILGTAEFLNPVGTLINNGVIRDDVLGGTLNINSTTITNNGTLQALNGGNLNLVSPVTGSGTITTDGSSTVTQSGITITGQTIAGLLNYVSSSNQLSNDTVTSSGVILGTNGAQERVTGAQTKLNGAININSGSVLGFGVAANESFTLNGSGTITLDSTTTNRLSLDNGAFLTIGSGWIVNVKDGVIGLAVIANPSGTLINNGVISDSLLGGAFTIGSATTTNNGTIQALNNDTVTINSSTTTNNGTIQVLSTSSLILASPVAGSGSITAGGSSTITQNSVFIGGQTISGLVIYSGGTNRFSNDTFAPGSTLMGTNAQERVTGSLTINGAISIDIYGGSAFGFGVAAGESFTLNGSGTINFDGSASNRLSLDDGAFLTIGAAWVLNGQNASIGAAALANPGGTLINNGVISDSVLGGIFALNSLTFTNNGTLQALNNGTLTLSSTTTTNNGTLQALNSSNLILATPVVGSGGSITADGTSTITQSGVFVTGQTIAGLFNYSSSNNRIINDAFAAGSTLFGNAGQERVTGGLTLNGAVNIDIYGNSDFGFGVAANETYTLNGSGTITFDGSTNNHFSLDIGAALTLGSGWIVNGKSGFIGGAVFGGPSGTLINNGVISESVIGGAFSINSSTTTNNGTIQVLAVGTLTLNSTTITNNGVIQLLNNSNLILESPIAGSGTITADGSSAIAQVGVFVSGQTIAGLLSYSSSGNRINNDTFTAGSTLFGNDGSERVTGALTTINGAVDIFGNSFLGFGVALNESITLNGNATFTVDGSSNNQLSVDAGAVLTLGPGILVHGKNATFGGTVFAGPAGAIINNGTIALDTGANGLFTIGTATFTNNGTISVASNDTVTVTSVFTNYTGSSSTLLGGSYNISGAFYFLGANIVTDSASITLSGANAAIVNSSNTSANVLAGFNNITALGSFTLKSGHSFTSPAGGFSNAGGLTVDAAGGSDTFTATGAYTQTSGSTTLVAGGTLVSTTNTVNINGGTLQGTGTVLGNVADPGTIAPGTNSQTAAAGTLAIVGNFTQSSGSPLNIAISGPSNFDQLISSGSISLNGPLNLSLLNGFDPINGAKFDILEDTGSSSINGTFTGLAEGATKTVQSVQFTITYKGGGSNKDVVLTVTGTTNSTTTTLTDNGPTPSLLGQPVSLIASVASSGSTNGDTVLLEDASNGNAVIASNTLSSGSASFSVPFSTIGTHNLVAAYLGDPTTAGSQSAQVPQTVAGLISYMGALPAVEPTTQFNISWFGTAATGWSISSYSVFVSVNGGSFNALLTNTTLTSTIFTGQANSNYSFYSVANGTDNLGNPQSSAASLVAATGVEVNSFLVVSSFGSSSTGFTVNFNQAFVDSSTNPIHLYTSTANPLGAAEVTLVGTNTGPVAGSLIVNPNNTGFTFVKTDEIAGLVNGDSLGTAGLLAADTYTFTLVSGVSGFQASLNGAPLDGNVTNVPGSNYVGSFVITSPPPGTVVVSIPDFARGPDGSDSINLPNNINEGIPLQVSNGSGLTSGTFTIAYSPALLNITGAFANPALVSSHGASLTINNAASTPGNLVVNFTTSSALGSGPTVLGGLVATVPANALYRSKEQLQIGSTLLAGATPVTTINDNAVQVVAYQADTSGLGLSSYNGADATLVLRASTLYDGPNSGFGPYETLDPVILGDIDNDGKLTGNDAALLANAQSSAVPQIANRPGAASFTAGPDPTLSLPGMLSPGSAGTVLVPVNIDDPKPVGSNGMLSAQLALRYDPTEFTVAPRDVLLGSVLSGSGWTVQTVVDQSTGELAISLYGLKPISSSEGGSLVTIALHENATATPASTPIALVASVNVNGHAFTTMVDDVNGPFTLTPAPSNSVSVPGQVGTVTLLPTAVGSTAPLTTNDEQQTDQAFANAATTAVDTPSALVSADMSPAAVEGGTNLPAIDFVTGPSEATVPSSVITTSDVVPASALTNAPAALIETGREQNTQVLANSMAVEKIAAASLLLGAKTASQGSNVQLPEVLQAGRPEAPHAADQLFLSLAQGESANASQGALESVLWDRADAEEDAGLAATDPCEVDDYFVLQSADGLPDGE